MYRLTNVFNSMLGKTYCFIRSDNKEPWVEYWVTANWTHYYRKDYTVPRRIVSVADWKTLSDFNLIQSIRSLPRKRNTVAARSEGQPL